MAGAAPGGVVVDNDGLARYPTMLRKTLLARRDQ